MDENDIGIDLDDLMQEGSIGLLNAIPLFDAGRGMKFLTYAAPALRNAMTDCIRAALGLFEQRMVDKKDGPGFQRVYLDDVLSELDGSRQTQLLSAIQDIQTMITCTGLEDFVNHRFPIDKIFKVVDGKVYSQN